MADYDSDSSAGGEDDIQTNVLLGYSSREPTGDDFSQLGGRPIWMNNGERKPSGALARCKICKGVMSLLLQLNGDLPDRFVGHERRLYVFGCRKKTCRRKDGSVRAIRAVRADGGAAIVEKSKSEKEEVAKMETSNNNLGEALFGVKAPTPAQANPFASKSTVPSSSNPFASSKSDVQAFSTPEPSASAMHSLPATFAGKAKISSPSEPSSSAPPPQPWPADPSPYPEHYVDAEKEYLEPEPDILPTNARVDSEGGGSSAADEKAAFESAMDKTFQTFADRLAQNPEQILRYEFSGQPLLYSKNDAVGKLLSSHTPRIPRCPSCGAARTFEMQLAPHAITELEAEETGLDGMEWGTIIVAVCSEDCMEKGRGGGELSYLEEWVGVQWEEVADGKSR